MLNTTIARTHQINTLNITITNPIKFISIYKPVKKIRTLNNMYKYTKYIDKTVLV